MASVKKWNKEYHNKSKIGETDDKRKNERDVKKSNKEYHNGSLRGAREWKRERKWTSSFEQRCVQKIVVLKNGFKILF